MMFWMITVACNDRQTLIKVKHEFWGCFGGGQSELLVYKQGGETTAWLKMYDGTLRKTLINAAQLDTLGAFVEEVQNLDEEGFCTTVEHYYLITPRGIIRKTDNTCSRRSAFDWLTKTLFPE
ncbi:MAG TPA: hypothetical protein VFZ47_11375 [Chitinophagaceae bacterium]